MRGGSLDRHARLALWGVLALAMAWHLPSLAWGFMVDDYAHQLVLEAGEQGSLSRWNLFAWGRAPQPGELVWEQGSFPWWIAPDWNVRFFRPLSSLLLWGQHALFGDWAPGYHAVGLGLFAAVLLAVHRLARSAGLSSLAALLAVHLVASEDGTANSVGWIANQNVLLEALFACTAVSTLMRAPREREGRALAVALLLAAGALLAKESGVVTLPLIALHLFLERRGRPVAKIGIPLSLLAAGAYLALYALLGFGSNVLFYPSPWGAPGAFLGRVLALVPMALASSVAPFPTDLAFFLPDLRWILVALAAGLALPILAIWRSTLSRHPKLIWAAAWSLGFLVVRASAPPSDRLLLVPSIGAALLLAPWIVAGLGRGSRWAWALFLSAAVASPALGTVRLLYMVSYADALRTEILSAEVGDPALGSREVLILQSRDELQLFMPTATWLCESGDPSVRFWPLQVGRRGLRWTRLDERSFELESTGDPFLIGPMERVFLTSEEPPAVGTRWETALFRVEATRVEAPGVGARGLYGFRVECDDSLDQGRYRFLTATPEGLRALEPPRVGETLELAPIPLRPLP